MAESSEWKVHDFRFEVPEQNHNFRQTPRNALRECCPALSVPALPCSYHFQTTRTQERLQIRSCSLSAS